MDQLNVRGNNGATPLFFALQERQVEVINYPEQLDFNINIADGSLPIHIVAAKGHLDIVRLLVERYLLLEFQVNRG